MKWWEAIVLGIVQGTTEWLPISSSGHLAISRALLGVGPDTFEDLMLHVGTLAVVLWIYRRRVAELIVSFVRWPVDARTSSWSATFDADRRVAVWLVVGSVPIALGGFLFADRIEAAFESLRAVGFALVATGVLLWTTRKLEGHRVTGEMHVRDALFIGLFQMFAVLPGVSRSGSTIAAGMHMGLDRKAAADFAFLLAIPALVGATLFKATDVETAAWGDLTMWLGVAVSTIVGYATLTWLIGFVKHRGLHPFAWYCWAVGLATLAWAYVGNP